MRWPPTGSTVDVVSNRNYCSCFSFNCQLLKRNAHLDSVVRVVWLCCVRRGQGIGKTAILPGGAVLFGGGNKHCTQVIGNLGGVCCWNSLARLVAPTTFLACERLDPHKKWYWQAKEASPFWHLETGDTFSHVSRKSDTISQRNCYVQRSKTTQFWNSESESVFEPSLFVIVVLYRCALPPMMQTFGNE